MTSDSDAELVSGDGAPMSYDVWAQVLADFFFDEAQDGNEILFCVDETSLAEAAELAEETAVASLASVVRLEVGNAWALGSISRLVDRWRKKGASGAHPALPILALTVLAASRMGSEVALAAHNYYRPLRHLLDPSDDEIGAPGGFTDYIERLWLDVSRWSEQDLGGHRGVLVVRDPGRLRYVGLAIQHALVRSSDLRHLDAFFRRIGLLPLEVVPAAELRRALAVWVSGRSETWARRLARICEDDDLVAYCEALLERTALRWDGRPRDPRTGRPVGQVRVGIATLRRPVLAFYAQWDERLPESAVLVTPSGSEIALSRWEGWYSPYPLPGVDVETVLSSGLESACAGGRFTLRPEDAYALEYDDDLGAWVSVDSISYGVRYHLLVRSEAATEVRRFLGSVGAVGQSLVDGTTDLLPRGWNLIRDVRIDARPRMDPPSALASLISAGAGPRLRLLGGLPISSTPNVYLRGGEPALALSTVYSEDLITVTTLQTGEVKPFLVERSVAGEIPLWELCLDPGRYEIRHGDSTVTLQIVDGIADAAGPGAGTVVQRGIGDVEVSGTCSSVPAARGLPVTVKAPRPGDMTDIIGARPGETAVIKIPTWMCHRVGWKMSWKYIDAWVDFEPTWRLSTNESGIVEAFLLAELAPQIGDEPTAGPWAWLIRQATIAPDQSPIAAQLWQQYRLAAGCPTL